MYRALTRIEIAGRTFETGQELGRMERRTRDFLIAQGCMEELPDPPKKKGKGQDDGV